MTVRRIAEEGTPDHLHLSLTQRGTAIVRLIAAGLAAAEIAHQLFISRHTVAQHVAQMLHRTDASTRSELVARAYASGVLATGVWPPEVTARRSGTLAERPVAATGACAECGEPARCTMAQGWPTPRSC
jgi:DNA-binding CsgD family transcriptional regulator